MSNLNPEQQKAVNTLDGPLLVLAGAGTGKTTVITLRIAEMLRKGVQPNQILAVTFTNKAAREMKERLERLLPHVDINEMTVSTFHSFCCRVLRKHIWKLGYDARFGIADEGDQRETIREILKDFRIDESEFGRNFFQNGISDAKNRLQTPQDVLETGLGSWAEPLSRVYARYQRQLKNMNLVDFDDLLFHTVQILREHADILQAYRDTYHYILVDEYQDTNAVQSELMRILAKPRNNICVVGDDDQSIYAWRGANVENILGFPQQYPGTLVIKLEQNYRSTNNILNAANAVIAYNQSRHAKALWSAKGDGTRVRVIETATEMEEARTVVRAIQQFNFTQHMPYNDISILFRSNHQSRAFEEALREKKIPYRLVGARSFYERREIKDAVAYLRIVNNERDDLSFLRILNVPPRGIGDTSIDRLKRYKSISTVSFPELLRDSSVHQELPAQASESMRRFIEVLDRARKDFSNKGGLSAKITDYLTQIGYLDGLGKIYKSDGERFARYENIVEFISAVTLYENNTPHAVGLSDLLEAFSLTEDHDRTKDEEEEKDGVTMMTVHAAKGLEFPAVIVVGVEQKMFPHERSLQDQNVDEERRLFYVALTRAQKELVLTYAKSRTRFNSKQYMRQSQFIMELPKELVEHHTPDTAFAVASRDEIKDIMAKLKSQFMKGD